MNTRFHINCRLILPLGLGLCMVLLLFGLLTLPSAQAGGPWYVSSTGNNSANCLSWATACRDIRAAVTKSASGDTINIAAGTYLENVDVGSKRLTFIGASVTTTIVDGNNADHVFFSDAGADILISNLTVQNGNGSAGGDGGGLYTIGAMTLTNIALVRNTAGSEGGGAYTWGAMTLVNVTVLSNTSGAYGGGVYAQGAVSIAGSRFENNQCTGHGCRGGGAYSNSTLTLTNTQFISNTARGDGGGAYAFDAARVSGGRFENNQCIAFPTPPATWSCYGGGLHTRNALTLTGTQFVSNTSVSHGTPSQYGCDCGGGGGAYAFLPSRVSSAHFENNRCSGGNCMGGGLFINYQLALTDTKFIGNVAQGDGGGVYLGNDSGGSSRLVNILLARNSAGRSGAAAYLIYQWGWGTVEMLHTTIASPTVGSGAAIVLGNNTGALNITNTIVASYTSALTTTGAAVHSDRNIFFNAPTSIDIGANSITGTDPVFVNPAGDDYHFAPASPVIDLGVPLGIATDLDGLPRPHCMPPDIGAYEYQSPDVCTLSIMPEGNGTGTVTSSPAGIDCGASCVFDYPYGTVVTLTATADAGSTFVFWDGPCTGSGLCVVTMDELQGVTAVFSANSDPMFFLTKAGKGRGVVTSDPAGIDCGDTCGTSFPVNTVITLTATPDASSNFIGWSGAVSGAASAVTLTVDGVKLVTATFALKTYLITPTFDAATGSIMPGAPQMVYHGDGITFTIAPTTGYHIADVGVDGASVGAVSEYAFTNVTASHTISAAFAINVYTLTVNNPSLNAASFRTPRFANVQRTDDIPFANVIDYKGNSITLTLDLYRPVGDAATNRPVIIWIHGGGFRTGTDKRQGYIMTYATEFAKRGYVCMAIDYRVRASSDLTSTVEEYAALVDATNDANTALSWVRTKGAQYGYNPQYIFVGGGSAGGRITVNLGIYDGMSEEPWDKSGLIALADLWGGPEPEMRMFSDTDINAQDPPTVLIHGTADTTVPFAASQDMYTKLIAAGVTAELHPIAGAGHTPTAYNYLIIPWMADFFVQELEKQVAGAVGNGGGLVISAPPGIYCGVTCTMTYTHGTVVTLTATPDQASYLAEWSGAITGTVNPVTFTMVADTEITATFRLRTYTITPTFGAGGIITPSTPQTATYGTSLTFNMQPNAGYHTGNVWVDGASVGAVSSYAFNNITADHTISATFAINTYTLTVTRTGSGTGVVSSAPSGINCGLTCTATYAHGTLITLTAAPGVASAFGGWSGALTSQTNPITLTLDGPKVVTASFITYRVYLPVVIR